MCERELKAKEWAVRADWDGVVTGKGLLGKLASKTDWRGGRRALPDYPNWQRLFVGFGA